MFQPVIPLSGNSGWNFLQSTYDRQLEAYSNSPQIRQDREYMTEKLSQPITLDDFMNDKRLLRVTMTAFGLGGEEWKGGFIRKVLTEVSDPESTFLPRLNNAKYTEFANTLLPLLGEIQLDEATVTDLGDRFEAASFEEAVGEVDDDMRLSLNFKSEIGAIAGSGSSEDTIAYKILGDIPIRTLLETATNLPSGISQLPVEKQAEIFKDKIRSAFGISNLSQLADADVTQKVIQRFHAMQSISNGVSSTAPGAAALTLLQAGTSQSGLGSQASQNLFLSLL